MSVRALIPVGAVATLPIAAQLSLVLEFEATIVLLGGGIMIIRTIFAFGNLELVFILRGHTVRMIIRQLQIVILYHFAHIVEFAHILIGSVFNNIAAHWSCNCLRYEESSRK